MMLSGNTMLSDNTSRALLEKNKEGIYSSEFS